MTHPGLMIRQVTLADAGTLLTLSRKTFFDSFAHLNAAESIEGYSARAFTIEKIRAELQHPGSQFYFALYDDKLAGYIKTNEGQAQTDLQDPHALELERIYVQAEYHGQKIGHALLNHALQLASDKHLHYVWLGVWEHNAKAILFYEKHGFTAFGKHDFMLGDEKQTDRLMKKIL